VVDGEILKVSFLSCVEKCGKWYGHDICFFVTLVMCWKKKLKITSNFFTTYCCTWVGVTLH